MCCSMSRLTRFLLLAFVLSTTAAVILYVVSPLAVGAVVIVGGNVGLAAAAADQLRRLGVSRLGQGQLRTGFIAAATTAPVLITGLVGAPLVPGWDKETLLTVQLLILSAGYAAYLLGWLASALIRAEEHSPSPVQP